MKNFRDSEDSHQGFDDHEIPCSDDENSSAPMTFSAQIATIPQHEFNCMNDESIGVEVNLLTPTKTNFNSSKPIDNTLNVSNGDTEKILSDSNKKESSNNIQSQLEDLIRMAQDVLGSSVTSEASTTSSQVQQVVVEDPKNDSNKFHVDNNLVPTPLSDSVKKVYSNNSTFDVLERAERVLATSRRVATHSLSFNKTDKIYDDHNNSEKSVGKMLNKSLNNSTKDARTLPQHKVIDGEEESNLFSSDYSSIEKRILSPQSTYFTITTADQKIKTLSIPLPDNNDDDDEYAFASLPVRTLGVMETSSITKEKRRNILNMLDGIQKSPTRIRRETNAPDNNLMFNSQDLKPPPSLSIQRNHSISASYSAEDNDSISSSQSQLIMNNLFESKSNVENNARLHLKNDTLEQWITQISYNKEQPEESDTKEDFNNGYENMYETKSPSSMVFHEINRGNWSWCSAWSPDGKYLAIGTENHGLAILDTTCSLVWKVIHDNKLKRSDLRTHSTHSIRHIAWGNDFIAIGGTGDAVSIIEPFGSFPIVHTIKGTGYVGQLSWRNNSSILAIASRDDQCLVVEIKSLPSKHESLGTGGYNREIVSHLILAIETPDWVNAITFCTDGSYFAIGDRKGKVYIYSYLQKEEGVASIKLLKKIQFDNSILDLEWSRTDDVLLVGGEDSKCTVISVPEWKILNRIRRDRWVQFVSPSLCGMHVVLGGGSSKISFHSKLEDFKIVKSIEPFDGSVLSAEWHPKNQFLALTGQDNKVVILETTTVRSVPDKCFHSSYIITAMDISVDGKTLIVGNTQGIVTFFDICQHGFTTVYELVLAEGSVETIRCSPDEKYVAIGGDSNLILVKSHPGCYSNNKALLFKCRYSLMKIMRGLGSILSISFSPCSTMLAISGLTTDVLDITSNKLECIQELGNEDILATAWSPDGNLLALIGRSQNLVIYHTQGEKWKIIFTVQCVKTGLALAWGPTVNSDLQYLAYGGEEKVVKILEIRTNEVTWETVLEIPRSSRINDFTWNEAGLLAVAFVDGNVIIIDLAYLKSGRAVNEMDYNWQRQGITCLTEIRNNDKKMSMISVQWMPCPEEDQHILALGSTNGFEMIDLSAINDLHSS